MGNLRSKIFTLLLCSAALVGCAFADGIPDPVIQINDPICDSSSPCAPLVVAGVPFTFMADGNGGGPPPGTNTFQVSGDVGFFSLDVQTAGFIDPASINCTSNRFNCTVTNLDNNTVTDMFFTEFICEVCSTGFPTGDVFTVNLGTTGWGADRQFVAEANLSAPADNPTLVSTPEPSSALLLCTGAAALLGNRKKLRVRG